MKFVSEGAESKIYKCKIFNTDVIAKIRLEKTYREKALDELIRISRTKSEARIMYRAWQAGIASPQLLGVGKFSIYMSFIDGVLLRDTKKTKNVLAETGKLLAKMHNKNIAHGDFTTANIMVASGKPYIIDFGLAEVTKNVEEKAIDLLLMKRSLDQAQYYIFEKSYLSNAKEGAKIKERLKEIEKRGRYKTRTLETA
ncbi:MAG: KEOPS complex kinase/ATPase Bud32 [Candidatus Micrarchaeia archaeon]